MSSANLLRFSAAVSVIALTTTRKLARNFAYYRNTGIDSHDDPVYRDDLSDLTRMIRREAYGMLNLMTNHHAPNGIHDTATGPETAPFLVSLAGRIYDRLEELHRGLLFFDAGAIAEIIPLVDRQRKFWEHLTDEEFYNDILAAELEREIPSSLEQIETRIRKLPAKSHKI